MSVGGRKKRKIIEILKYLNDYSDMEHPVTTNDIIAHLEKLGIESERKSIYDDLAEITESGIEIEKTENKRGYYTEDRTFETAELKMLVDAVQSAKFISVKKSNELISKIEHLTSVHRAKELHRQVYVLNRAKTTNESVYYSVDEIHTAIDADKIITFRYFDYNSRKQKTERHGGAVYKVSPWGLTWDDENYYLVGYDNREKKIKHYRVDKMLSISVTDEEREGKEAFEKFDMAIYSKKMFGMYGGTEKNVTIKCDESLAGIVIDRFGIDVQMIPDKDGFIASVKVTESPLFYSWVFSFGPRMKIISPQTTVDGFKDYLEKVTETYSGSDKTEKTPH